MLAEAFAADPEWAPKGPLLCEDPGAGAGGRVVVELMEQAAPRAVKNFLSLCTGAAGLGKASKKPLHYKVCSWRSLCVWGNALCALRVLHAP